MFSDIVFAPPKPKATQAETETENIHSCLCR